MNEMELKEILRKHKLWLNNEDGGERANLSRAKLSYANLKSADLSGATGLMRQWKFIRNNFESTAEGIIAYKTFCGTYQYPEK